MWPEKIKKQHLSNVHCQIHFHNEMLLLPNQGISCMTINIVVHTNCNIWRNIVQDNIM